MARLLSILAMTRSSNASTASSTPGQMDYSQICFMLYEDQDWMWITNLQEITLAGGSGRLKIWKTQFSGHRSPSVWRHSSKTLQVDLEQKHATCNAGAPILKCYYGSYNILAFDCHDICHKDPSKAKKILDDPKYDNDLKVWRITLFWINVTLFWLKITLFPQSTISGAAV